MTKTPSEIERDIAASLATPLSDRQPLYGHTSEATAYLVDDYPYGFRERSQIRYWLEHKAKKGWRFVAQTKNPKTGRWNKPKESTYTEFAAAMFSDERGHVHWDGVGPYSDEHKVLAFVRAFPDADLSELRKIVPLKQTYLQGRIDGAIIMTINGVKQPMSPAEVERTENELCVWSEIRRALA